MKKKNCIYYFYRYPVSFIYLDKQIADLMAVWNVWDHLASDVFYQSV